MNISRRNFLKGGLAFGATAAMGMSASALAEQKAYTFADTVKWDAQYDVVVLGLGFAGMTAAITAADAGASVLVAEKMSEALAGGNSKVAGQLFAYGHGDREATMKYYTALTGGRAVPEAMLNTIVDGVTNMWDTIKDKFFNGNDAEFMDWTGMPVIGEMSPEYPEFPGADKIALCTTHAGVSDSFLYKSIKECVYARADKIDVWFESPAVELIQDPDTKTVVGVTVTREGKSMNVRALNGVCVCTGGFECDPDMVQTYLNITNYSVIGGQYNTGDGLKMCQKIGADMWHMSVYEGGFACNSLGYGVENGGMAYQVTSATLNHGPMNTGAMLIVGTDGERFGNESAVPRHGHLYENGIWENPNYPNKTFMIFDQAQYDKIMEAKAINETFIPSVVSASSVEALAEMIGCKPATLAETVESYNSFAANGKDYQYNRPAEYMAALEGDTYYAMPMTGLILNTQGGPKRNEHAEILDLNGNAIPHLYSAGEMGGITSCMYQGGTNIAECLIFGAIAGGNAAAPKAELAQYETREQVESAPAMPGAISDVPGEVEVEIGADEYVGSAQGMMGPVTVKVKMADGKIANVEVVEQSETDGIGSLAIDQMPARFEGMSTAEEVDGVDTVATATITSNAIKEAVKAALLMVK